MSITLAKKPKTINYEIFFDYFVNEWVFSINWAQLSSSTAGYSDTICDINGAKARLCTDIMIKYSKLFLSFRRWNWIFEADPFPFTFKFECSLTVLIFGNPVLNGFFSGFFYQFFGFSKRLSWELAELWICDHFTLEYEKDFFCHTAQCLINEMALNIYSTLIF